MRMLEELVNVAHGMLFNALNVKTGRLPIVAFVTSHAIDPAHAKAPL